MQRVLATSLRGRSRSRDQLLVVEEVLHPLAQLTVTAHGAECECAAAEHAVAQGAMLSHPLRRFLRLAPNPC